MLHRRSQWFAKSSLFSALLVTLWALTVPAGVAWSAPPDAFAAVKLRLRQEGYPATLIAATYRSNAAPLLQKVANSFHIQESKLNYGQFLQPAPLAQARQFLEHHEPALLRAERRYGVDPCTITAILLVESRFGEYTGQTPTVEILSSFALLQQKTYRDTVWRMLSRQDQERWGRAGFNKKAAQRAQWAYGELGYLLQWGESHPHSIESFRGSSMGAIGWPQFLPSSLLQHGVDGNRDGKVDLFQPTDAIFSVANYLQAHGWNQAKNHAQKEAVIYVYNHSQPYVDTVLSVAAKLRHMEAKTDAP